MKNVALYLSLCLDFLPISKYGLPKEKIIYKVLTFKDINTNNLRKKKKPHKIKYLTIKSKYVKPLY